MGCGPYINKEGVEYPARGRKPFTKHGLDLNWSIKTGLACFLAGQHRKCFKNYN
jgi:hypothetical protein